MPYEDGTVGIVISIHASRGGSDYIKLIFERSSLFQSTLPAGEATAYQQRAIDVIEISIHASRGGSDFLSASGAARWIFQSTLPAGEATPLLLSWSQQ